MIGLSAAEDSSTSTTESTVELPIEIHGEIIDCLDIQHDAHDTTANCAFVRGTKLYPPSHFGVANCGRCRISRRGAKAMQSAKG